jgi:hypothetical protein
MRASTTGVSTPLIEILDEIKKEDEEKKKDEEEEEDGEETKQIKKRNEFLALAKKISSRKVVNDDRILKVAKTYVRVRDFMDQFDFAANKIENESPKSGDKSLTTRERFGSKVPDDGYENSSSKAENEILDNFPALVMVSAEKDDKGGYWTNINAKKKFVPDIVTAPRYLGFGHAPSLFCKSLIPALEWSKRNLGEISLEDVAAKSNGWTKIWDNENYNDPPEKRHKATVAAWMPIAPDEYVAMGVSFTSGPDCLKPPRRAVLCLKKSLSSEVKIKECPLAWTDAR